ncbi:hypothetical protein BDP55DRAFT_675367 [Colletotrichum godetiae]|uniref:Uncharacterized protein n=1 Tax=Colletotrichum godetiae TaxID=1209918 RepID=A0AAJ0ETY9_9PEZI|nr:uncharacterized protein BDP55DRAFT_675367 [Colletotrichum godetiae]KAK1671770.1 hypothetical protein BDP55DRAFT_675367 [Colletotrichum godetiae]
MPPPSSLGAPERQWPIVLGIDWGSTSIRLVLYHVHHTPGAEQLEPLWDDRSSQRHDPRSEQDSFSSYITIFGEGEDYVGDHVDLGRQRISTKACLRRCCAAAGLESPQFIHEEMGKLGTFNIARGAAIARAKDMSFRNFLENGAAIGVQMLQAGEREWDNVAKTILDENGGKNIEIIAAAGDRLRLICDPFCRLNKAESSVEQRNSYDMLELPAPSEGRWMYMLDWKGYSECTLALLKRVDIQRTYDCTEPGEWDGLSPLEIPIYFDRSANCFLVNTNGHDIEFLRRDILMRDDGTMTECPEQDTGGAAENEDPEEGARAIQRLVNEICSLGPRSDIQPKTRKSRTLKRRAMREEGEGSEYFASMKKRVSYFCRGCIRSRAGRRR